MHRPELGEDRPHCPVQRLLTEALDFVSRLTPGHLPRLHDHLDGPPLRGGLAEAEHGHHRAQLQGSLDLALLIFRKGVHVDHGGHCQPLQEEGRSKGTKRLEGQNKGVTWFELTERDLVNRAWTARAKILSHAYQGELKRRL